jgi:Uma2 family endonuclease
MTTTAFAPQIEAVDYNKIYSVEEYFEIERHSDIRHEFHYGKLIAMPGESIHANLVAGNIYIELRLGLHNKPFVVCNHDVKTIVRNNKIYRYPDVVVATDEFGSGTNMLKQPVLLVEVVSEGSLKTDNVTKVNEYRNILTTQYYMIVEQDEMEVRLYRRTDTGWSFESYDDKNSIIALPLLDITLDIRQFYKGISLSMGESRSDE